MKKREIVCCSSTKKIILTLVAIGITLFFVIPLIFNLSSNGFGNVAVISIDGVITADGISYLGSSTISSKSTVSFLKEAEKSSSIKAIIIMINSPGGSAVASDEISAQIKKMNKPVIAVIRETGASGGYWIASATDYIIANRMSLTGSIGVTSSYLEFSGLLKEYGVGYEQLTAGQYKDMGTPFRKLTEEEKKILQSKLDKIHSYFIQEIAQNRNLSESKVKALATGEVYLGVEALNYGLVDELGDQTNAELYLKNKLNITEIEYVNYAPKKSLVESMLGVFSDYCFRIGEGIGSVLITNNNNNLIWV